MLVPNQVFEDALPVMDVLNSFLTNYFSHFKQNETKQNLARGRSRAPGPAHAGELVVEVHGR